MNFLCEHFGVNLRQPKGLFAQMWRILSWEVVAKTFVGNVAKKVQAGTPYWRTRKWAQHGLANNLPQHYASDDTTSLHSEYPQRVSLACMFFFMLNAFSQLIFHVNFLM